MNTSFDTYHLERVRSVVNGRTDGLDPRPDQYVVRSWERCVRNYHLDPINSSNSAVLLKSDIREREDALGELLPVASEESRNIYSQTQGSGYAIIVTDFDGVVMSWIGDPTMDKEFNNAGLWTGAIWDEKHEGTNGIGTCIAEGRPVTIHREDHFLSKHGSLSCTGAPIRNSKGDIIAVLDASITSSNDSKNSQIYTAALMNMSAKRIEHWYFIHSHRRDTVLRLNRRPEMVGTLDDALFAIDGEGNILAVNNTAVESFGSGKRKSLVGKKIEEVFDFNATSVFERASRETQLVWPARLRTNGERHYCLVQPPERVSKESNSHRRVTTKNRELTLQDVAGDDIRMRSNVDRARRTMNEALPILLCGETGTGKEAMAKAIHAASDRADKPFVAVNCASIPESLIESELFGYRYGAFTGARREGMRGKVLASDKGTLFLDEIGEMNPSLQTRLLRVLEERYVYPLASDTPVSVDLHVISATNKDMKTLISDGSFRKDLYYRLAGVVLHLPALREREDKKQLVMSALALENNSDNDITIDDQAMDKLLQHPWPGNFRELRFVLRAALALCTDNVITLEDLPEDLMQEDAVALAEKIAEAEDAVPVENVSPLAAAERDVILKQLENHHWNVTKTAAALGMSRKTLYRRLHRHNISTQSFR